MENYERVLCEMARSFWHLYILNHALDQITMTPDCIWIGASEPEYYQTAEALRNAQKQKQEDSSAEILEEWYKYKPLSGQIALVYGGMRLCIPECIVDLEMRFSMIFQKNHEEWELSHVHLSAPSADLEDGDSCLRSISVRVQEMLARDRMTGLYHHEGFWRKGREKIVQQQSQCYCFLMDINEFKMINDTYGHLAGDVVLKNLAEILRMGSDPQDIAGRIGVDEFALLCFEIQSDEEALRRGEWILSEFRSRNPYPLSPPTGLSIGITKIRSGEEMTQVMQRADEAMYKAKADRRSGCYML